MARVIGRMTSVELFLQRTGAVARGYQDTKGRLLGALFTATASHLNGEVLIAGSSSNDDHIRTNAAIEV